MDVRDRSTYTPNMDATAIQSSRVPDSKTSGASEAASPPIGEDSSRVSTTAKSLAQTMQLPDVREDRITGLQQRIAMGNYQVSSQDVADAMLRNVAD